MESVSLTPKAEELLQEILDNRLDNGECNIDYWQKRFENLSFDEDSLIRSIFKELIDKDMISVFWASDCPVMITLLNNGLSYFDIKKEIDKREKQEKRSDRLHDIKLIIIGAVLAGAVQFFLFKFFGIGG